MNDIEAAEKVIASLTDRRDRAAQRSIQITDERQKLGYEVFVNDSKEAKAQLAKLNVDFANLAGEMEGIDAALVEARYRLTAAQNAVARDVAAEHRRAALAALESLVALAPKLDELVRHPHPEEGQEFYSQNDPPTVCAAAKLVTELVNHMRALRLTVASFPQHWHPVAGKMDFERELLKTISVGWPSLAIEVTPRVRSQVMPGQKQRTPEFGKIFGGLGRVIRKNLEQHERANKAEEVAA